MSTIAGLAAALENEQVANDRAAALKARLVAAEADLTTAQRGKTVLGLVLAKGASLDPDEPRQVAAAITSASELVVVLRDGVDAAAREVEAAAQALDRILYAELRRRAEATAVLAETARDAFIVAQTNFQQAGFDATNAAQLAGGAFGGLRPSEMRRLFAAELAEAQAPAPVLQRRA